MLPCNIVVRESDNSKTVIAIVNPMVAMRSVNNPEMDLIAGQIYKKLNIVINNL